MYPLKFNKIFIPKVWGGRDFENVLNMSLSTNENIGESWEVSCHKKENSVISNGIFKNITLQQLINIYGSKILGKEVYNKYKQDFPLLIKYLDIHDKLSIQVHPSNEYALEKENEFGKSECWYIISASEDAKLYLGLKEDVTKEKFEEHMKNRDFTNIFNEVPVKTGDFINITPGTVHGSCEGSVLICEIQQNSDITYRIYDFDRKVNGELRPLHLDKALEVISFGEKPQISSTGNKEKELLLKSPLFNVEKLNIKGRYKDEINKNFKIYSIIDGSGELKCNRKTYSVTKGETLFIPAGLNISFKGEFVALKSYL